MHHEVEKRQIKGWGIIRKGDEIFRINKLKYLVRSQTTNVWYLVERKYRKYGGTWECECKDYRTRKKPCKHIYAVGFLRKLHFAPASVDSKLLSPASQPLSCDRCGSFKIIKYGFRHNKCGDIQRHRCKKCNFKFVTNYGFKGNRINSKIISLSIDLYLSGLSGRKVCGHLYQFYDVKVSHVTVLKWIRNFGKLVSPFVDSLIPQHLSGVYHVDEMMVHVRESKLTRGTKHRSHYSWLWNFMDNATRIWISGLVSQRRHTRDARAVFSDAKTKVGKNAHMIIHDGYHGYDKAYGKEFFTLKQPRVRNVRSVGVQEKGLNCLVERLNGSVRDREIVMRGMHSPKTAQEIINAMRAYYNCCRKHQTLGKPPIETCGLHVAKPAVETLMRAAGKSQIRGAV